MICKLDSLLKRNMEKFVISCIFSNYLSLHHNIEVRYDVFVEDFKVVDKAMARFETRECIELCVAIIKFQHNIF